MELSPGAMGVLLTKLGKLLGKKYNLKKGVKKGIKNLKTELEIMQAKLVAVSHMPQDQLDMNDKLWASELRALSYAINDSLAPYMVHVEGLERFIKKTRNKITKFKVLYEITDNTNATDNTNDVEIQGQVAPKDHSDLSDVYKKVSDGINKAIGGLIHKLSEVDVGASKGSRKQGDDEDTDDDDAADDDDDDDDDDDGEDEDDDEEEYSYDD